MNVTLIGIIIIPIAIIISFKNIKWIWMATAISSCFTATSAILFPSFKNSIAIFYVFGGCFIIKIAYLIIFKKYKIENQIFKNYLSVFMVICCVSIFYPMFLSKGVIVSKPSGIREELFFSLQNITQLMYLVFAYLIYICTLIYFRNEKVSLKKIDSIFRISVILILLVGVLQYFTDGPWFDSIFRNNYGIVYGKYRITSANNEASFLALFLTPMLAYFLYSFLNEKRKIDLAIVLIIILSLKYHSSSSFILGAAVIILSIIIYFIKILKDKGIKFKSIGIKKIIYITLSILIGLVILALIGKPYISSLVSKLLGEGESGGLRTLMFKQNFSVFKEYFLTGVGFGSLRSGDLLSTWLAQVGIIGVSTYIVYIISRIKKIIDLNNIFYFKHIVLIIVVNVLMLVSIPEPFYGYLWIWYATVDYILLRNTDKTKLN